MKLILTACLSLFVFGEVYSQDTISVYFDSDGKPSNLALATYFKSDKTGHLYLLTSNKSNGKVEDAKAKKKSTPVYEPQVSSKDGVFVFRDSLGIINRSVTFSNNACHGFYLTFYKSGTIRNQETYNQNKLQGICNYFYENGQLSSEEVYDRDSLIEFKLYQPDGSVDETASTPSEPSMYPGGNQAMMIYLMNNIRYPPSAIKAGVSGRVYLRFSIDEKGVLKEVNVQKGIEECPDCSKESIRVVKEMPRWKPARDHNRYVKSYFSLPIRFEIGKRRKWRK